MSLENPNSLRNLKENLQSQMLELELLKMVSFLTVF